MNGEERKAYIAAVLMANPEYLDSLAPKPFTKEDISKVTSIILLVYLSDIRKIFVCENCENSLHVRSHKNLLFHKAQLVSSQVILDHNLSLRK